MKRALTLSPLLAGLAFTPVYAQEMKLDTKQPIEITADSLEVSQNEQLAVFSGNVVAVQGQMRLASDRMDVHYRSGEQVKGEAQAVSRIKVDGNVFMRTPTETARSLTGLYDVDANMLTLNGDVVLTRGENVVKGDALRYDLVSGKSKIVGAGVATGSSVEGADGGKKGRVRGLFVPDNGKESTRSE